VIDTATRAYALEVEAIRQYPTADNLTMVKLRDHAEELVANKREDGSFRYVPGQILVLLPVGAILPQWILEEMDAWKVDPVSGKGKGLLAGNQGNRVGSRKFAPLVEGGDRYESRGALRPARTFSDYARIVDGETVTPEGFFVVNDEKARILGASEGEMTVVHGTDVTDFLGITFR
jgi:hypothetical protein